MKKVNVPYEDVSDYIQIFNGIFDLTGKEKEVLSAFVENHLIMQRQDVYISPFSTPMKKRVAKKLGYEDFNRLNVYIMRLKEKRAISPEQGGYKINPLLIPGTENQIVFNLTMSAAQKSAPQKSAAQTSAAQKRAGARSPGARSAVA